MADFWTQFQQYAPTVGMLAPQIANSVMTPGAPRPALPGGTMSYGGSSTFQEGGYGSVQEPTKIGSSTELGPAYDPTNPNAQLLGGGSSTGGTNYQSTFMSIMGGLPATPQNLAAKEAELRAAGIEVKRNAEGTAGKVKLPNGQIVDVIQSAGTGGGGNWQWLTGPSGGGGGMGDLGNFQVGMFTGGGQYPLSSVMGTGLAAPWTTPFVAPTDVTEQNDPGFQFRLKEGQNALERSAAAKGTLLTGGFQKALNRYAQDYGSQEYGNVYARKLGEYQMANAIFNQNQNNLFNRLFGVAGLGQNAAAQVGNAAGAYGQNASNTITGIGNAQGAGTAAGGAAWGNAVGNIGNIAATSYLQTHPQTPPAYNQNWTMTSPDYGY